MPCLALARASLAFVVLHNASGLRLQSTSGREQWPQYPGREVTSLTEWEYSFVDSTSHLEGGPAEIIARAAGPAENRTVPSVMHNPAPGEVIPQGTGIYRRQLQLAAGRGGLLEFRGCAFSCRVFVDDQQLADHRSGGYSPFWVEVPPAPHARRNLTVLAERTWEANTVPLYVTMDLQEPGKTTFLNFAGGDMGHHGGLHREVFLHTAPSGMVYIRRALVIPKSLGTVDIRLQLRAVPGSKEALPSVVPPLRLVFDGEAGGMDFMPEPEANGTLKLSGVAVPKAKPWSPQSPNLHTVQISFVTRTGEGDTVRVRFGLRQVEAKKQRLILNRMPLVLKGVNRHSTAAAGGSAMTREEIERDVQLLQELGVNFVRGAHYQQDQRFLDLCDERGILVWEEPLSWGNSLGRIHNSVYRQEMLRSVDEMLDASANHPSVIVWGLFNEGPSQMLKACDIYAELAEHIRSRDSSRMVAWAHGIGHSHGEIVKDKCVGPANPDFIAVNSYPGWYGGQRLTAEDLGEEWKMIAEALVRTYDKPVVFSELGAEGVWEMVGGAGDPAPFSQEYQAKLLDISIRALSGRVSGIVVWQFADTRTNDARVDATHWERRERGPKDTFRAVCTETSAIRCRRKGEPRCRKPAGTFPGQLDCGAVEGLLALGRSPSEWPRNLRPKGMNNKGLVDLWRRKKLAFDAVRSAFAAM